MTYIQGTVIIRDRGQLTIPGEIRKSLKWPAPNAVVSLVTITGNELIIKPYERQQSRDWEKIWLNIKRTRAYQGKRGDLSEFIASDRENH